MTLTYEVKTTGGYVIYSDGVPWIVQTSYIPYPGDTDAQSAENHIAVLEQESANSEQAIQEERALRERVADLECQLAILTGKVSNGEEAAI